jgi:hypothetical protein
MYNPTYMMNKGQKAMDILLTVLCMALCNKVPKGVVTFRTDSLASKIKLVTAPKGTEAFNRTVDGVTLVKNTNERAVVRILVPKRSMTLSEVDAEQKNNKEGDEEELSPNREGEEEKGDKGRTTPKIEGRSNQGNSRLTSVPSERIIETDQEERALAIGNKINLVTPYMVLVMN